MRVRQLTGVVTLTAFIMGGWWVATPEGQGAPAPAADPSLKTPWGAPDLNGIWDVGFVLTPLERPKELADKEFLTDEEVAQVEKAHRARLAGDGAGGRARSTRGTDADLAGAYNQAFSAYGVHEKVIRTKRTSLIIDPPDGRIPALTPEGQKRLEEERREEPNEFGPGGVADHPEQRKNDRCIGSMLPFIKGISSGNRRIVQSPDMIAIYMEDGHVGGGHRMIPIGTHPHLPSNIRQFLGSSRARWEGDTLVVEVKNLSSKSRFQGSRENLELVERFTRAGPDLLIYRVTVTDPTTFTRPWTIELPLTKLSEKENKIYESACNEGNYAMVGILAGARAREREKRGLR